MNAVGRLLMLSYISQSTQEYFISIFHFQFKLKHEIPIFPGTTRVKELTHSRIVLQIPVKLGMSNGDSRDYSTV